MIGVFVILVTGVLFMACGGRINKKLSNKLMVARVVLQAISVLIIGLLFLIKK